MDRFDMRMAERDARMAEGAELRAAQVAADAQGAASGLPDRPYHAEGVW